jgi:hypothetical protein
MQPLVQVAPPDGFAMSASTAPSSNAGSRRGSGSSGGSGSDAGKWIMLVGMVIFIVAAVAIARFALKPAAEAKAETPVVLTPRAPTAGLPTDLGVIVRVEAESARHTALQTVEQIGSGDVGALAGAQPDYHWIAGDQPSTDPHTVSVSARADGVTIAVAAPNHDVCAFGRWSPTTRTAQYVTMGHQSTCAAVNAPAVGWSGQAGGAGSDLPDDINS